MPARSTGHHQVAAPPVVRPLRPGDESHWRELYRAYADFYEVAQTDEMACTVWGWIHDPGHAVEGLVAVDDDDTPIGLAHFRPFARPLSASTGCYLDDLFVRPQARGAGAADALLAALRRIAHDRDWSTIRWITRDDNYRACGKYDQHAQRTAWITYDTASAPN